MTQKKEDIVFCTPVKRLTFTKLSARTLQPSKVASFLARLHDRVVSGYRSARGWHCKINDIVHEELESPITTVVEEKDPETREVNQVERQFEHKYSCNLDIVCVPKRGRSKEVLTKELEQIVKVITITANSKDWTVESEVDMPEDYRMPGVKYREAKEEVEEAV